MCLFCGRAQLVTGLPSALWPPLNRLRVKIMVHIFFYQKLSNFRNCTGFGRSLQLKKLMGLECGDTHMPAHLPLFSSPHNPSLSPRQPQGRKASKATEMDCGVEGHSGSRSLRVSGLLPQRWKLRPCTALFLPMTVQESKRGIRGDCGTGREHNKAAP